MQSRMGLAAKHAATADSLLDSGAFFRLICGELTHNGSTLSLEETP